MPYLVVEQKIASELQIDVWRVCLIGSTLICGKGNDQDFICLVAEEVVIARGFQADVECFYESPFRSFRRGDVNLIVTTDERFFFSEVAIAHAAKQIAQHDFDMTRRVDRVMFHSEVRENISRRLHHIPVPLT
jgi:hypothetical protein